MLPCARSDAALCNKGVGGCARRVAESRKLQGKKSAPFKWEVFLFVTLFKVRFNDVFMLHIVPSNDIW